MTICKAPHTENLVQKWHQKKLKCGYEMDTKSATLLFFTALILKENDDKPSKQMD